MAALLAGPPHARLTRAMGTAPATPLRRTVGLAIALLTIPAPLLGQTPEQRYADWTALDFAPSAYAERRARLIAALGALGDGVLLVPGAEGTSHGPTFRQLDDMWYFTGLELPSSLLIVDGRARMATLYAPARDPRFDAAGRANDFPGRPLADDPEIARLAGIEIRDRAALGAHLRELADRTLLVNLGPGGTAEGVRLGPTPDLSPEDLLVLYLRETLPQSRIENAFVAVARVRSVKTAAEIERIRRVAAITQTAIALAAARVVPGITERELEGWFELGCKRNGAQRIPFHPIIKSGPNALWPWRILAAHYDRRNRQLEAGDVVIFDVGCELDHYVSDVGRTFPVSGRFTEQQAAALALQREVSAAIIAAIRPGVTFADLQRVAEAAIPAEARPYMQTGSFFGHHLGLSTGDPVLTREPLVAGMVFTVEPWYYDHDTGVSVFVEDMVLVTETGVEILTSSLPRTAAELADMVGRDR